MEIIKNYLKLLFFLGILLLSVGCTSSEDVGSNVEESESEQNIRTVLQNTFTGPSKEQEKLLNGPDGQLQTYAEELGEYHMEHFKPYLSDRFFESYIVNSNMALSFLRLAHPDYEVKVDEIEIEEKENYYTFTVDLSYTHNKSNKTNTMNVKGNVQTNEDDKLTSIQYSSDFEDIRTALE
ncbi:hypothetical protein DXT76_15250 [Halobacillus trueperi]|uniref:Uncharacterized protein n=1 Tax=Halobacillus trueperi TaxID=156205 RepID=A0A3D8VMK5_9BACI|nr:hypothetical protein [Halobacillus trueperi]RDY70078.1 hypothetical protein DXT76_15250 [Halobacillus trueperi]